MTYGRQRITFTVAQIGSLDKAETENAVALGNLIQRAFYFEFYPKRLPLDKRLYRLPNSGYDLDTAVKHLIGNYALPRPLIFVTSLPYGDKEKGRKAEYFFYSDLGLSFDPKVSIISTYRWSKLPGPRRLQPYLLYNLAAITLTQCASLEVHDETRGCLFDYCEKAEEIDLALKGEGICNSCERFLNTRLRSGEITVEQLASAKKLLNRASGRKICFMVMPFNRELSPVYDVVGQALRDQGWTVLRADEIARPRRITDAILQAILMSDLVVADLTGSNPNVFYEIGLAHAIGCDVIMLTQERRIPFDITTESTIFYKPNKGGLRSLDSNLRRLAGI